MTARTLQLFGGGYTAEVAPDQPMALGLLQAFLDLTGDQDRQLPMLLREGVKTGVFCPLPAGGEFEKEDRTKMTSDHRLLVCDENWKQANLTHQLLFSTAMLCFHVGLLATIL